MTVPIRMLTRTLVQCLLCFLCFNIGFMVAFYQYNDASSCGHKLDPNGRAFGLERQKQKTFLVIAIISSPVNFERRQVIRDTWLNVHRLLRKDILCLFVIGSTSLTPSDSETLSLEITKYKDILQLPGEDAFQLLTQKVLSAFVHVDQSIDFQYLLKVDDDSFVRVAELLEELKNSNYDKSLYWGFFDGRAPVIRQKGNKWRDTSYVLCDRYIPYALGGGYVISQDLVHFIAENANHLEVFHNEDVSVGTWLAPLKVHRVHDSRFDTEFRSRGCSNKYLVTHKQSVEEMRSKQYSLISRSEMCEQEVRSRLSYSYDWSVAPSKCCERTDQSALP